MSTKMHLDDVLVNIKKITIIYCQNWKLVIDNLFYLHFFIFLVNRLLYGWMRKWILFSPINIVYMVKSHFLKFSNNGYIMQQPC